MDRYDYSGAEYDPDSSTRNKPNNTTQRNTQERSAANVERSDSNASFRHRNNPGSRQSQRRQQKRESESWLSKAIAFLRNRRFHAVLGIFLILLAGYLTICAVSFLRSGSADQSIVNSATISEVANNPALEVENIGGPVGAKVSNHLFVEGLGLGSIVLLVYMVMLGLSLLRVHRYHFWSLTFKTIILAITLSMVIGFLSMDSTTATPLGGYHGRYINQLLEACIGNIGTLFINLLLIAIVVIIYLNEITRAYRKYRTKIRTLRDRKIREKDQQEFTEALVEKAMEGTPLEKGNYNDNENTTDLSDTTRTTPITITDEVDSDPFGFSGSNEAVTAAAGNIKQGSVNNQETRNEEVTDIDKVTDTRNVHSDPDFQISKAENIEQAVGDNPKQADNDGKFDPRAELSRYNLPTLDLLHERPVKTNSVDLTEQQENKERIIKTLRDYGVEISRIEATVGPTITLYEIVPAEGVRINRITRLADDIAMSLAALGIRIIAPIPGKGTIGIEVPNKDPQTVSIRSILGSKAFRETKCALPMALGATISNDVYIADLAKMPHLLVAGATGQGKSVGLNTIIASLLYKLHPAELKFVLIDPKMVEFSLYARLEKHYLAKLPNEEEPIVTEPSKAVDTLNSLCVEMDQRYALLKMAECRSLEEYNKAFKERKLNPEKGHRFMPYIVMIVDEFADLMMTAGKSIETPIARIAQKARAVGMHMIIATQRPSTNVITGIIKANFPARIGFRVSQMVDSRTILDSPGANQLIGRGDMLISANGSMHRVQCAFIDTDEVNAICHYIDSQVGYPHAYILPDPPTEGSDTGASTFSSERDSLFEEVARWIVQGNNASTSQIQRRYAIGYNRAGKIMDQLEASGIVGPNQGGKPRQVLVDPVSLETILSSI